MKMELSPDAGALREVLSWAKISRRETAIDEWFRTTCDVTFHQNDQTITAQDDLGYFFQKWFLLIDVTAYPDGIWFMGAQALFRNGNVVIKQGEAEIEADRIGTRALLEAVSNELERQLDALVSFQSRCESDADYIRKKYLAPLRQYVGSV